MCVRPLVTRRAPAADKTVDTAAIVHLAKQSGAVLHCTLEFPDGQE